jgi:RNA polymerase sigma-70 factor (ECF subfamily)
MSMDERFKSQSANPAATQFTTTHWSVVFAARDEDSAVATDALAQFCRSYWYPLYAYVRRRGYDPHEAQDLTQEFLAELIARRDFAHVDPSKGKFRSFLLACLKHFLAKDWRDRNTLKRGGGQDFIPLDTALAEERVAAEAVCGLSPERLYDRGWATTVMEQSLEKLRQEWLISDKGPLFEELKLFLIEPVGDGSYVPVAARLNMTPAAVATMVHRLRNRYREVVRATLLHTVSTPFELDEEMRYLLEVLT